MSLINIYCDESCHLEHDGQEVMVLGAVWCPRERVREIAVRLREIKAKNEIHSGIEVKWNGISPSGVAFYQDVIDYFFDDDDLHFRAVVIPFKDRLTHESYGHDHDTWYYKMYFQLIEPLLAPENQYKIFLDIKDTRSADKLRQLHDVLCNSQYDFSRRILQDVQAVRSHEVEQVQLADLLVGAVGYHNRGLKTSESKLKLIQRIKDRSRYSLDRTTLLRERKFNIFVWRQLEIAS